MENWKNRFSKCKGILSRTIRRIQDKPLTSEEFCQHLRSCGVKIGQNCRIFDTQNIMIDTQNPHMLSLGDNVRLTRGVIILTHDYSWSVCAGVYGECLGGVGSVTIGSNVFIGMNSIILKGTEIGDNVIIGAGSVVHGVIKSNSVYAGNPAREICSLEAYYNKLKKRQYSDCCEIRQRYQERYGTSAPARAYREYFWLFADRNDELSEDFSGQIRRTGYEEMIRRKFSESTAVIDIADFTQEK